jgi:hypothetical protein
MNLLFSKVVWIGIIGNWIFAFACIFFPTHLVAIFDLGVSSQVWMLNYAILLIILSCFYIPAANDPVRYKANCYLLILGRLIPASVYFIGISISVMPMGFLAAGFADMGIGLLQLYLYRKMTVSHI